MALLLNSEIGYWCRSEGRLIEPFTEKNLLHDSYALTFDGSKFYRCFKTYQVGRRPYAVETFEPEKLWARKNCCNESLLLNAGDKALVQIKEKVNLNANSKITYANIERLEDVLLDAGLLIVPATSFLSSGYSGHPQLLIINMSHVPVMIRDGYQLARVVFHVDDPSS